MASFQQDLCEWISTTDNETKLIESFIEHSSERAMHVVLKKTFTWLCEAFSVKLMLWMKALSFLESCF